MLPHMYARRISNVTVTTLGDYIKAIESTDFATFLTHSHQ